MTSINLISPKGKADNFKVRFREPIEIKENSKIYLNYAHLTRFNEIVFDIDQTITFSDIDFIPAVQPADGVTPTALTTNTVTIPSVNPFTNRRAYNVSDLERTIKQQLDALRSANPELFIYSVIERLDSNREGNSFLTGFFLDDDFTRLPYVSFSADATHQKDASDGADPNGIECVYFKNTATNANRRYDSYALSSEHFFHFSAVCSGNGSQLVSGTFLKVKTNVNMNSQQGNICFGLYSKELADEPTAFTGWTEKTTGSGATTTGGKLNPAIIRGSTQLDGTEAPNVLQNAKIACFLNFEITGVNNSARNTNQLKISVPTFDTQDKNKPMLWDSLDKNIRRMVEVRSVSLRQVYTDLNKPFEAVVVFYVPITDLDYLSKDNRKFYFRIYQGNDQNINPQEQIPIYDSKVDNVYFPEAFFTGLTGLNTGTPQEREAKVKSAIPFSVILASQDQNEGFETVDYKGFSKNAGGATTTKPNAIMGTYKLKFSDQLGEVVGALESEKLFPNVCEMNARFFYFNDIISKWRNDSFDVYLNGLPIKNFKNKQEASDGGFGKALLTSIPVPFLDGNSIGSSAEADYAILTGFYQPTIKNVLKLNNQPLNTNTLNVEIKNTNDETPAKQLHQAHICFTITDE